MLKKSVELINSALQERLSERICGQIVHVSVPQVSTLQITYVVLQERISERVF